MMKSFFYSFVSLFFSAQLFGQVIKTYNGKYEKGNAIYQYYENENYERILHGNFLYKEREFEISGKYKNNLRNGLWKAVTTIKKGWDKNSPIINEVVTANYVNGKLEGSCTYKKLNVTTSIVLAKASVNFRNNMMVGNYKFESINDKFQSDSKFSIDCFFTMDGFLDGTMRINYNYNGIEYQDIQEYRTGFLYWALCRNLSNGVILKKYDRKNFIEEFYSNYDSVIKVSIIPYSEFLAGGAEPKYLSSSDDNTLEEPNKLGERKNVALGYYDDTVYYKNAPFTFIRTGMGFSDYETTSSYWNLNNGLNFWNNCENCNYGNPLYRIRNGILPILFLPVKQLALDDKMYKEMQKKISN